MNCFQVFAFVLHDVAVYGSFHITPSRLYFGSLDICLLNMLALTHHNIGAHSMQSNLKVYR